MIPKKIHYCWFGRNPLPESAQKCIASWRKYFPDYEIIEWNEDNFDINAIPYTAQAYAAKKYAFVSDYARFKILYEYGGVYFDTDVEVIRPMDDIIAHGAFMGFEIDAPRSGAKQANPGLGLGVAPGLGLGVAPGLGLGVAPGLGLYAELLELYRTLQFILPDGSYNTKTIVSYTTEILAKNGLADVAGIQHVAGIYIYPKEYFNPLDDNTGRLRITENTRSIHWYSKTWLDVSPWRTWLSRMSHRIFGDKFIANLRRRLR